MRRIRLDKHLPTVVSEKEYLCTIPDTVVLTRDKFKEYLRKFPRARKFGFSKKHTEDITKYKRDHNVASLPDKIYDLPVQWSTLVTYLA
jgi:hypothetical protein